MGFWLLCWVEFNCCIHVRGDHCYSPLPCHPESHELGVPTGSLRWSHCFCLSAYCLISSLHLGKMGPQGVYERRNAHYYKSTFGLLEYLENILVISPKGIFRPAHHLNVLMILSTLKIQDNCLLFKILKWSCCRLQTTGLYKLELGFLK